MASPSLALSGRVRESRARAPRLPREERSGFAPPAHSGAIEAFGSHSGSVLILLLPETGNCDSTKAWRCARDARPPSGRTRPPPAAYWWLTEPKTPLETGRDRGGDVGARG